MPFQPRLDILPTSQRLLWDEFRDVPTMFTLYGGTAVALHLGHRQSIDFDFFASAAINPASLYAEIPFLRNAQIIQQEKNTLTCIVDRGDPVMIWFFGLPHVRTVQSPQICVDNQITVASLIDLAGTKAAVVQQRAEAKDYVDLDSIITAGVSLPMALAAAKIIYGPGFNPQITLKALSYFADGDLNTVPEDLKHRLVSAVLATDLSRLPTLSTTPDAAKP